ncbi:hypothetical protein [Ensifer sp. LCM 4579]|uniref:hypothetical protein n=1 Tax=Ensifer sp. LCM 4579 TaxID=1848292 RepID=UPI0008D9BA50|nr:hypothetical protein [Ensifer sp. LCM 4579]OHV80294.1 hypothetical protein LCM4579_22135 [Ensifer sp. LCM 4579]
MPLLKTRHYNLALRPLLINTCALALVFAAFRALIDDTLTLGYAMGVAVFLYISATTENARIGKSGFGDIRPWLETLAAAAIAAAVAYLGYKAWLMGY